MTMLTMVSTGSLSILNLNLMENILRLVVRHIIFMLLSFTLLYIVCLSFGGSINYFAWAESPKFLFGVMVNVAAVCLHGYWFESRS